MSNTPRTDCVMQHGLAMTGKDELVYLARTLERQLAAAIEQRDSAREDALEEAAKKCHNSIQVQGPYFATLIRAMKGEPR